MSTKPAPAKPFRIQHEGTYITKGGEHVQLVRTPGDRAHPWQDARNGRCWSATGRRYDRSEPETDIIARAPVEKPKPVDYLYSEASESADKPGMLVRNRFVYLPDSLGNSGRVWRRTLEYIDPASKPRPATGKKAKRRKFSVGHDGGPMNIRTWQVRDYTPWMPTGKILAHGMTRTLARRIAAMLNGAAMKEAQRGGA